MAPHEFLAAVLPPPGHGYYCVAAFGDKRKQHEFVSDVAEVDAHVEKWMGNGAAYDVYFALATFEEEGARTADNARMIRTVAIDMDGYETKREAAEALDEFLGKTGLDAFGTPWVVSSGGGLHCYWVFDAPVEIAQWKPVAENLKRLCKQEGLAIDMTVTADAARVLRIPGTMNFKKKYGTPRPVKLVAPASEEVSFAAFATQIRTVLRAPAVEEAPALAIAGERPTPSATGVKLLENSSTKFKNIIARTTAGTGCSQLAYFVENAADEGMEPLWRGWLSIAKATDDCSRAAPWLSKLHPYDETRMQQKLREIKGPYPCIKFDAENPGLCTKCPHWGKITNPLALGRELISDNEPKEVEIVPSDPKDPEAPAIKVMRPSPPKGFSYGANGGVYADRMIEEADGTKRKQQVLLLPYTLFVVDLLNKDGEHTVHMVADRPGAPVDVLMPQRYAVSKDECLKTLAQQNIIAAFGAGNDKNLFEYVRACIEEASVSKKAVKIPQQYGWQEDDTFVYNGRVYRKDGTTVTVPMPDLANLTRITRSQGTLEEWRKFPQMLIRKRLYEHLAMACISFGAPLMRFTQMAALTFHAGSTDSGTGKSLALSFASSIWGHPQYYRTGKSTSAVTMQQRMGNLNSLPFVSDEITHKSRQDMEWFPGFIFDAAEGQGKEKSEVHHNRERLNLVSWATLVFLTSNTLMHDYMSGARTHSSQGELMRMLEWTPEKKLNWTAEEEEVLKLLATNHGVAGEKFVRWLVQNQETARRVVAETIRRIKIEWAMSGDERYWAAGCGATIAGAILASKNYADIIDLPIEEIMNVLHQLVIRARVVAKTGKRTAEDVLNTFIRDNYGSMVIMKHSEGKILANLGNGDPIDQSITRSKVMGRVEHEIARKGYIELFMDEQVLKAHCVAMSYGYDAFKRGLKAEGYDCQYLRKDMLAKTKGPQMRVRAICISRPVTEADNLLLGDNESLPVGSD